jgi:hypothetical protein
MQCDLLFPIQTPLAEILTICHIKMLTIVFLYTRNS